MQLQGGMINLVGWQLQEKQDAQNMACLKSIVLSVAISINSILLGPFRTEL